eukprot:8091164-Alexandrium_andersonii.AAC.1
MLQRALSGVARVSESLYSILQRFKAELCAFVGARCRSEQAEAVAKAARAPVLRHLGFWAPVAVAGAVPKVTGEQWWRVWSQLLELRADFGAGMAERCKEGPQLKLV